MREAIMRHGLIRLICCGLVFGHFVFPFVGAAQDPALQRAAEQGEPRAQLRLGVAYATGNGAPKDGAMAVRWLEAAANSGEAKTSKVAAGWLGAVYKNGMGVKANGEEALRWSKRGAELGSGASAQNIAEMYSDGKFLKRDTKQVDAWYAKAAALYEVEAQSGDVEAAFRLAKIYNAGVGVSRDRDKAIALLETAHKGGHSEAGKLLADIRSSPPSKNESPRTAQKSDTSEPPPWTSAAVVPLGKIFADPDAYLGKSFRFYGSIGEVMIREDRKYFKFQEMHQTKSGQSGQFTGWDDWFKMTQGGPSVTVLFDAWYKTNSQTAEGRKEIRGLANLESVPAGALGPKFFILATVQQYSDTFQPYLSLVAVQAAPVKR
jgi:TPR repeat protein